MGLYCVVVAASMAVHRQATVTMVTALLRDPAALFLSGLIALLAGLALLLGHNVWSGGGATVLVTVVGWVTLVKGLTLMFLTPETAAALYLGRLQYERFFYLYTLLSFVLGTCLILLSGRRAN
jgi:hypothetical protein